MLSLVVSRVTAHGTFQRPLSRRARLRAQVVAGLAVFMALLAAPGVATASYAASEPLTTTADSAALVRLHVRFARLGDGQIHVGKPLVLHAVVSNPGTVHWLNAQAYLQITPTPATTARDLDYVGGYPDDPGLGSTDYDYGDFVKIGNVAPGQSRRFTLRMPYAKLGISGTPGVYRVELKVVAGTSAGRDPDQAAYVSTLMPLLPTNATATPAQTVTLLPLTAPVKRLVDTTFADDSLGRVLGPGGRLRNALDWALQEPPDTVQVVIDPALLAAVSDMARGYRVKAPYPDADSTPGKDSEIASNWLAGFQQVASDQHVLVGLWGTPAANSLLAQEIPLPVLASVRAARQYLDARHIGSGVAGWLTDGNAGEQAVATLRQAGVDVQVVSQASLPGLKSYIARHGAPPAHVIAHVTGTSIPLLVTRTEIAGLGFDATTSPLQVRQRLLADAAIRSLTGTTSAITVAALPFDWNPRITTSAQTLGAALSSGVMVAQSAVGALDRAGPPYRGRIRAETAPATQLSDDVRDAVRQLQVSARTLASVLSRSNRAQVTYDHVLAMAGSVAWNTYPRTGIALMTQQYRVSLAKLAKVGLTGPPFVAMSSDSGKFPLTVTNNLGQPITIRLSVRPEDPALSIASTGLIRLPAGERRDIQITTTAKGSGVTSVDAWLAAPNGRQFGHPWRFDVRSTQIGLVIWVVMGVGAAILLLAAGYRIFARIRGRGAVRNREAA